MARTRVRHRRVVALVAAVATIGLLGPVARAVTVDDASTNDIGRTYVVRPGDTLWSIATRFESGTDPRVVVDRIASANGLDPGGLVPGQEIIVPSAR